MYGVSRLDYSRLRELRYPIYGLMIGLVLVVLAIAHGDARREVVDPAAGLQLPALRAGQGPARARAGGLRGRPDALDGAPDDRADHAARAGPDDAGAGRAGPRLGDGLRRGDARDPVRRRRPVAALRRARRAVRGGDHGRARGGPDARRRGAQALPGGPPDVVPAPVGEPGRRGLPADAVQDRHRLGREDRPRRRERHPDFPELPPGAPHRLHLRGRRRDLRFRRRRVRCSRSTRY